VNKEDYLGLKEAARYLSVSRNKMYLLVRAGEIPFYVSPLDKRKKLFRREDLDALKSVKPMRV